MLIEKKKSFNRYHGTWDMGVTARQSAPRDEQRRERIKSVSMSPQCLALASLRRATRCQLGGEYLLLASCLCPVPSTTYGQARARETIVAHYA